ncbi:MAG: hypothetical protein HN576_07965 [Bacteriovoracaceae bacterium]|jgi:hypothetical protein|nr:hypothetical protein [Bacteriovoracaceae bacterium]
MKEIMYTPFLLMFAFINEASASMPGERHTVPAIKNLLNNSIQKQILHNHTLSSFAQSNNIGPFESVADKVNIKQDYKDLLIDFIKPQN